MKAIFLDIDGVLTNSEYLNYETRHINPEKVRLLSEIVMQTGAVIVLTSTWKDGYNKKTGEKDEYFKILEQVLEEYELSIYDITDHIPSRTQESMQFSVSLADFEHIHCVHGTGRAAEVEKWIREHHPENYVILDDEDHDWKDYGYDGHWVQTSWFNSAGGLNKEDVTKAIQILEDKNIC